ncbi:MAG: VOC family protein [Bacillota bacterium]
MKYLAPAVSVSSLDASRHFYCDVLGFSEWFRWENTLGVERGGARLILDLTTNPARDIGDRPGHGITLYMIFDGSDIDAYYSGIKDRAQVLDPIEDKPWGDRAFSVADPDGYRISVSRES